MKATLIKYIFIILFQFIFFSELQAESAHEYVEKVHDNIIEVIKSEQKTFDKDPDGFIESIGDALSPLVDFRRISQLVMGKYYKEASAEQRNQFKIIFRSSLLNTYAKTLAEFRNEEIRILPPKGEPTRNNRQKVYLEIVTDTKTYSGAYSMYLDTNLDWKLINITINGVNLGVTFRNQFYALMDKNSLDIDIVLEKWTSSF